MLDTFKAFLDDPDAIDMYITGQAGTGKTTGLAKLVEHVITKSIVCAFTHKACDILRSKLPAKARVNTLHKYLKKRPTINSEARHHKHIESNAVFGDSEKIFVLFVDEYSMVGERDLMDIRAIDGLKVVWIGDSNQLPPVGDAQAVIPYGDYNITLTKVYRQANDNPLLDTLQQLVSFIEGAPATELAEHRTFTRAQDLIEQYDSEDSALLAFTNKRVEDLNAEVMGRIDPLPGDLVHSPTTKETFSFDRWVPLQEVSYIMPGFGDPIALGSKYRTLEFLISQEYRFAELTDEEGETIVMACVFGHYQYKQLNDSLKRAAASSNAAIGKDAAKWASNNKSSSKAATRAKAWRAFLSFNEAVVCLDFNHAMTIHKSQGSTYKTVYLDIQDLAIAADINYALYLKLMYVALSRASNNVVTN